MNTAFTEKGLDSPRLCAEMLVAHVLGCDRLRLYTDPDRPASPLERETLRGLVARALRHEPIQYLVGEAWFFGLPLYVDRRVLVPRACTEAIVEQVIQHARARPGFGGPSGEATLIADVCTGSGCIAVALARHLPHARVIATDISPDALEVTARNAERHGVSDRLDLRAGNLLEPVLAHAAAGQNQALSYLCSNPPYILDAEWDAVPRNVREHEPERALRGGPDGLQLVAPIVAGAAALLRPGGLLLVEIASVTREQVLDLCRSTQAFEQPTVLNDLEGKPRTLVAVRS
ncbi:MAG: peptide chain release factor N(5)-glutamine methyltransferase [Leptolyngbya sp. PLA3]|nr:MAG: peptide chain release factor N(5)-glutamine methyltransferase [Cyanobacteria bacterium CYA]MCE7968635.1 peptide chain release factor N(5)-glutamine methyltransferase [Leptolyngbya sp. PL-A3]